jgi:hypothetical protein
MGIQIFVVTFRVVVFTIELDDPSDKGLENGDYLNQRAVRLER